jgi:probable HAF family extracellular repeat protein
MTKQSLFMRPAGAALAGVLYGGVAAAQVANITPIVVPNSGSVTVSALNQRGNVAGYYTDGNGANRAFFWDGIAVDQGTLGGSEALGFDVNDFDQTTGYAHAVGDVDYRAFLGTGQTLFDLGTLGGSSSLGRAINNSGAVTGYSFVSPSSADFRAVLSLQGFLLDLGTLGGPTSTGVDVNEHGHVAGDSDVAGGLSFHGFYFDGAAMHDVGTLGGAYSLVTDLNNHGQVTGSATTADDAEDHAYLYGDGVIQDLGTLGGPFSIGYTVNDAGVVAGDSSLAGDVAVQGFVWQNGVMTSVGHLGSQFSSVWGLNNSNQVVGASADTQGVSRAFLWQNGTLLDLNTTLPAGSGWVLEAAYHINDLGQIVGTGYYQGQASWYRLQLGQAANQPPVAVAGADVVVECGVDAVVDGGGSSDPDGDSLAYAWFKGEQLLGQTALLAVRLDLGVHVLRLRVTDPSGEFAEDEVVVTVRDGQVPSVTCPEGRTGVADGSGVAAVPDYLATLVASDACGNGQLETQQEPAAGTLVGPGVHPVVIRVADAAGNVATCETFFSVQDTTAPSLTVPASVTRAAGLQCSAEVPNLLGEAVVSDNCTPSDQVVVTQEPAAGTVVGLGVHAVVVRAVDAAGNATVKTVSLHVVDQAAPVIHSVAATPNVIRPANKQLVPVTVSVVATDACDPQPINKIVGVLSSDPAAAEPDRTTTPDWVITGDLTVDLRAATDGDVRVYTVVVESRDNAGNSSTSTVQVTVQKNKNSRTTEEEAGIPPVKPKGNGK